jgi:hypothetical protein
VKDKGEGGKVEEREQDIRRRGVTKDREELT